MIDAAKHAAPYISIIKYLRKHKNDRTEIETERYYLKSFESNVQGGILSTRRSILNYTMGVYLGSKDTFNRVLTKRLNQDFYFIHNSLIYLRHNDTSSGCSFKAYDAGTIEDDYFSLSTIYSEDVLQRMLVLSSIYKGSELDIHDVIIFDPKYLLCINYSLSTFVQNYIHL